MILLIFIFFIIDLISKILVLKYLDIMESINIIGNFLKFTHVNNTGAAFSMFSNDNVFVLVISLIIIISLVIYVCRLKNKKNRDKFVYSMILGGAIGNLFDRLVYGYVIDFIDIDIFGWNYPIFNLADSFIVVGVFLLIIFSWRKDNGNNSK